MENTLLLLSVPNFGKLDVSIQKIVYREFYHMAYGPIYYMIYDHAATEDVIQDAFLQVVRKMPAIENEAHLKGWMKVVIRNTTLNYLRKNKKNRNEVDVERVFTSDSAKYATAASMVENNHELKEMSEAIQSYMKHLKPEFRIIIEMRWKQEMSYKEIAEELGCKEETVKFRLHRAREAIKKRYLKEWGGPQ